MTRAVVAEARRLELAQFRYPEDRMDINEVRRLALEQVADDTSDSTDRDRIGREWIIHADTEYSDQGEALWKRWTPEQQALEAGLAPFLVRLPRQQREVLHLRYWGQLSQHQVAAVLRLERRTVRTHEERGLSSLRASLVSSIPGTPEYEEAV